MLVALEVDIALICASAPVLKPLFRRYFNNSSYNAGSHEMLTRAPLNQERRAESGMSFQDAFQVVELGSVDHTKISGETQKPLPPVPESEKGFVLKKDENSDGESMFIIQQLEIEERKPANACCSRTRSGGRCQKLNELWARQEPCSGV